MGGVFGAFSRDFSFLPPSSKSSGHLAALGGEHTLEDTYLGLFALQHRGQQSAGLAWVNGGKIETLKAIGLLQNGIEQLRIAELSTPAAIGQVRYSGTGGESLQNAQPLSVTYSRGSAAVAHDGSLSNAKELVYSLEQNGAIFQTTCDTEVVLHLMAKHPEKNPIAALAASLPLLQGGFALLFLLEGKLVAARDPWGFRPLVLGQRDKMVYIASESCALDLVGANYVRDIEPGEMVVIDHSGVQSQRYTPPKAQTAICSFEYVYTARADSVVDQCHVYAVRKELGRLLAKKANPLNSELVTGMPDSGTLAALGYAQASGLPYEMAVNINRYVGRTFIRPTQRIRELGVKIKLNPNKLLLSGKSTIVVDDSIVRGTTSKRAVALIRESGAREVHLRIAAPPVRFPCHYGIDTPSSDKLVAAHMDLKSLCQYVGADSLAFIDEQDLIEAIGLPSHKVCTACFSGHYPVK